MSEPIRVLQVFGRLNRGGAESRLMDIYRQIDRNKVQFDFIVHGEENLCGDFSDEIKSLGGKIFAVPRYKIYNAFCYKKAWRKFLSEHKEYSIVHIQAYNIAGIVLPLLAKAGIGRRIVHAHATSDHILIRKIVLALSREKIKNLATDKIAVSKEAANYVFRTSVQIVHPAFCAKDFAFDPTRREKMRRELGLENAIVIGHVGRFNPQKNHIFLFSIFADIARIDEDAVLVLVGDGITRAEFEKLANERNLADRVHFLGLREDVPALMQAFDIFVLPSLYEGLPGVVAEAQAAGLPCLVSDVITKESVVVNELCEFLPIDNGTASWIDAYLQLKSFRRKAIPEEAFIEAGYDAAAQAKWYEKFYKKFK